MSAFLCSEDHIGALCDAAAAWDVKPPEGMTLSETFKMLAEENLASLAARYDGEQMIREWTARVGKYKYMRRPPLPVIHVLKLLASYEYQSCEHDLWIASDAYDWCYDLRRAAVYKLPGIDTAPWSI